MKESLRRARGTALGMLLLGAGCESDTVHLVERLDEAPRVERIDGQAKRAAVTETPFERVVQVDLSGDPWLIFSIAAPTSGDVERGRVHFTVHVLQGKAQTRVFGEDLRLSHGNQWRERAVNLAAWRGQSVGLVFEARSEPPALSGARETPLRVAWGEPRIEDHRGESPSRPSFVLILVDTLRRDYLGTYGFAGDVSPNLDWLAAESIVFENALSQAPWTKPSIASLFTSVHPDVHGVDNHGGLFGERESETLTTGVLAPEAVTLAETFRENGYRTAAFVANPWLDPDLGFAQGFDSYELDQADETLIDDATAWMNARDEDEPFFLYLHLMGVHGPYDAPEEDFELLRSSPSLVATARPGHTALAPYLEGIPWFSTEELASFGGPEGWGDLVAFRRERSRTLRARYAANVRRLDRNLGNFLNRLRNSPLAGESVVALTSDHGEELLEHGGWDHGFNLYDHQLRVPMIIRLPGAREARRREARPVDLIDVAPTLLGIAGIAPPSVAQGRDLTSIVNGAGQESRFVSFATATKHRRGVYSVRTDKYKLIYDQTTDSTTLYDLRADPDEYHDRVATEPQVAHNLLALLRRHLEADARAPMLSTETVPVDERLRKALESLGYLER